MAEKLVFALQFMSELCGQRRILQPGTLGLLDVLAIVGPQFGDGLQLRHRPGAPRGRRVDELARPRALRDDGALARQDAGG